MLRGKKVSTAILEAEILNTLGYTGGRGQPDFGFI
jgi:hypothetical protein